MKIGDTFSNGNGPDGEQLVWRVKSVTKDGIARAVPDSHDPDHPDLPSRSVLTCADGCGMQWTRTWSDETERDAAEQHLREQAAAHHDDQHTA